MGNEKLLKDLEPKLSDNFLNFLCPICIQKDKNALHYGHRIVIPITRSREVYENRQKIWMVSGETVENASIHPSIATETKNVEGECMFHGWVKDGKVTW